MKLASFCFFPLNGNHYACGFVAQNLEKKGQENMISLDYCSWYSNQSINLLCALSWKYAFLLCFLSPVHNYTFVSFQALKMFAEAHSEGELSCLIFVLWSTFPNILQIPGPSSWNEYVIAKCFFPWLTYYVNVV